MRADEQAEALPPSFDRFAADEILSEGQRVMTLLHHGEGALGTKQRRQIGAPAAISAGNLWPGRGQRSRPLRQRWACQ